MATFAFMNQPLVGQRRVRAPFRLHWSWAESGTCRRTTLHILALQLTGDEFWKRQPWAVSDCRTWTELVDDRDSISQMFVELIREILALDKLCTVCDGRGWLTQPAPGWTYWQQHPIFTCAACSGSGYKPRK